jgi:peroxiredoxin
MLEVGTPAPDFRLPDTSGKSVGPADFANARALGVAFIWNHCRYIGRNLKWRSGNAPDYG